MDVLPLPKWRNKWGHGTRGTRHPVSASKQFLGRRTTALAAYPRDVAILRAVAALDGRLPADVLRDALEQWVQAQPEVVRAVAEAVENRLAGERGS